MLLTKFVVQTPIEDVGYFVPWQLLGKFVTISHHLRYLLVKKENLEAGYDGEVLELLPRFPGFIKSWLLAIRKRAAIVFLPGAGVAAAAVNTAIDILRLEAGQSRDLLLNLEQRSKVPEVFWECMAK